MLHRLWDNTFLLTVSIVYGIIKVCLLLSFCERGDKMSDRASNLEKYRFSFLLYLSTAEKLLRIEHDIDTLKSFLKMFESGRGHDRETIMEQHRLSVETGKVLLNHYGASFRFCSRRWAEQCLIQLKAQEEILNESESMYWRRIATLAKNLWSMTTEEDGWYLSDEICHHELFLSDRLVEDRILYIQAVLRKLGESPASPGRLEASFQIHYDGMIHQIPLWSEDD